MIKINLFLLLFVLGVISLMAQIPDSTKLKKVEDKEIYQKTDDGNFEKVDGNLYEMDLASLLDMEVSTVSKKSQNISQAPAIVSIITQEQIEMYGVETLTELMTYVPGFSVKDTYWKRQIVTARGISMSLYNDKILMLINGVPAYGAAAMEHFLDLMPITSISRIEIIRGPGSTLYGTNAFSAVINVITKNGNDDERNYGYVTVGSHGTKETGIGISDNIGEFKYHFGATFKDQEGYQKDSVIDEYGAKSSILYEHDNYNIFGSGAYKGFMVNAGMLTQKWSKFGPLPGFNFGNNGHIGAGSRAYHDKYFANLIYEKSFKDKWNIKGSFHYDFVDKQSDLGQFGRVIYQVVTGAIDSTVQMTDPDYYRFSGYLTQEEVQIGYAMNDKLNFMAGFSAEQRTTTHLADLYTDLNGEKLYEGSTSTLPLTINDMGGYFQVDGKFGILGYVAGIRATYLGISEKWYMTPRAGLVANVTESTSIKLLYGNAFRGAGPQEQYYKVPILIYGLDAIGGGLEPEQINTFELAFDQKILDRYKVRVNGFMLDIIDLINRRPATAQEIQIIDPNLPSTMIYDNLGKKKIQGVELELTGYPTDYISFWANLSYKDGEMLNDDDSVTCDYLPFIEKTTANAGVSFKLFNKKLTISPNFQYVGERSGTLVTDTTNTIQTIDAYSLINCSISYKFNNNLTTSITLHNITDEEYFYPEDVRRKILTIPGGPGFGAFVKLKYTFN